MISEATGLVATAGLRIDANDFELFGLPVQFEQERLVIDARWKLLQRQFHPDRFVTQGDAAQRIAMQWVIRANEAYQRLKSPLGRAAYLCKLHGDAMSVEEQGCAPAEFLEQLMTWREALQQAATLCEVDAVSVDVGTRRRVLDDQLGLLLDRQRDWEAGARLISALMFIERLEQDVLARRHSLDGW